MNGRNTRQNEIERKDHRILKQYLKKLKKNSKFKKYVSLYQDFE